MDHSVDQEYSYAIKVSVHEDRSTCASLILNRVSHLSSFCISLVCNMILLAR